MPGFHLLNSEHCFYLCHIIEGGLSCTSVEKCKAFPPTSLCKDFAKCGLVTSELPGSKKPVLNCLQ